MARAAGPASRPRSAWPPPRRSCGRGGSTSRPRDRHGRPPQHDAGAFSVPGRPAVPAPTLAPEQAAAVLRPAEDALALTLPAAEGAAPTGHTAAAIRALKGRLRERAAAHARQG